MRKKLKLLRKTRVRNRITCSDTKSLCVKQRDFFLLLFLHAPSSSARNVGGSVSEGSTGTGT
jgi:hypothetical protein